MHHRFTPASRLLSLLALVAAVNLCAAAIHPVRASGTEEWPRFRGPEGNGTWNPAGRPVDLAESEPRLLWKATLGGGYGGVTVAQGNVYVMDRQSGSGKAEVERILCFDGATGKARWEHSYPTSYDSMDYGNGPRASVTVHEGRAYTLGARGVAVCLDAITGKVHWQVDLVKDHGGVIPTWGFAASPFLWKDTVLLHCGAQPSGSVVALDRHSGRERWRGGSDPAGYCTPMVIQSPTGPQLIQWGPKHITSLNPDSGAEHWRYPYEITYGVSIAQPLYHEGLLFVSGYWHGSRALRLGEKDVKEVNLAWSEEKTLCGLMSQPLYKDGHVYLLTKAEGVICFRLQDGKVQWKDGHQLTPKDRNPQISLVWLDEKQNLACGLNASGELFYARFTPEKMEELARHQIIGKTWAHPAFAGNRVFARSDSELRAWQVW
jgi:outer membrane protein assembly factor BamB